MLELYAFGATARVTAILIACVLLALQACYALYFGHERGLTGGRLSRLAEWALVPQYAMLACLPAIAQIGLATGLLPVCACHIARGACALIALGPGVGVGAARRRWDLFLPGALAGMTLPWLDGLGVFGPVYGLSLLSGFLHVSRGFFSIRRARRNSITYGSIRRAMDLVPLGLLFYDADGYVRLENVQMQRLLCALLKNPPRDGRLLWQTLCAQYGGEEPLARLEDHTVWRFTQTHITAGRHAYLQIRAAEVTDLTARHDELERNHAEISRRNQMLREMLENIDAIRRAEEIGWAQRRIHDVLGLRISILQRLLREHSDADACRLEPLMRDLLQEMRSDTHPSAALLWQDLCACFAPIGVRILRHGEIPEDGKTAYVLVTALREAITNAVRHAYARQIDARFFRDGPYCCMAVTNDGPPPEAVVEGNGLGGIRQSVERLGGSMRINCTPRFTLIVCLPEGSDV